MEANDFFSELNQAMLALPQIYHEITYTILLALYAHLLFGTWLERKKFRLRLRTYIIGRNMVMLFYLSVKAVDPNYGMFDAFLPIYLLFYLDGLLIAKGNVFNRCRSMKDSVKRITSFNSKKI